jgi:DNA replicative helicase MCM subunit Mcm2 (Cdc46/Mcm family)
MIAFTCTNCGYQKKLPFQKGADLEEPRRCEFCEADVSVDFKRAYLRELAVDNEVDLAWNENRETFLELERLWKARFGRR